MPKEIVVSHRSPMFDDTGREVPLFEQGFVQVGWDAGGELVQIATRSRDPVSFEVRQDGYFVDIDRRQINELIRHLRRARDQAFGRDE